ncbi:nuclear pore complex protein Nup98-Nup96-like isoform X2 [Schistocerca piceifrons]|uniref:nuclear pore complex protein Nup98-Nup96-like isoform X2 n=1 Tax=Schistocerca piceifrons TaxID=274613 RepID=UPI001F5FEC03|nr:nuclear pore complex protein Nup98-Nup96-like isoform X2 [Schistocerca piceifrons]
MAKGDGGRGGGGVGCGIHLTREDYYTSPPFHQLKNYTECGIYTVEKLTIGRNGFGSITFDSPINIKDLNFDDIVHINHKEVIVYPNEEQKPPAGHGLNCAAEVRLEKVWPFDSCVSKYITDPRALEEICFVEKLKETNHKCSTKFINYIPESGTWIFKVEHFSKYGLSDTDDEGDEKGDKKDHTVKHGKEKPQKQLIHAEQPAVDLSLKSAEEFLPLGVNEFDSFSGFNESSAFNESSGFNGVSGLSEIAGIDGINGIEIDGIRIDGMDAVNIVTGIDSSLQTNAVSPENEFTQGRLQFISNQDEDDVVMKEAYPTPADIVSHITDTWLKPFCLEKGLDVSEEKIMSMKRAFFPEDKESGGRGRGGGGGGGGGSGGGGGVSIISVSSGGDVGSDVGDADDEDDDEEEEDDDDDDYYEDDDVVYYYYDEDDEDDDDDDDDDDVSDEVSPFMKNVGTQLNLASPLAGQELVRSTRPLHVFPKYSLHLEDEYSGKKIRTSKTKTQLAQFEEIPRPKGTIKQRPPLPSVTGLIRTATIFPEIKVQGSNMFETSAYKYPNHIVPLHETSTNKVKSRSLRDIDLYKGHGFRVGWGPGGVLLILTTQKSASTVALEAELQNLDKYLKGRSDDDNSKQIVQRICLRGGRKLAKEESRISYENELREYWGKHLKVMLKCSEFYKDRKIPGIRPIPGSSSVTLHGSLRSKDDSQEREYPYNVWNLCDALWGELPEYVSPTNSHHNLMQRKQYLGDWLTFVYQNTLLKQHDGKLYSPKSGNDCYLEDIWNLVTGNMIKEACNLARENGDLFMITLLTQLSSGQFVNHLMREQVTAWINVGADGLVKRDRLKLFLLICGLPLFNANDETVNVCERLDWKRILGLHLCWMVYISLHAIGYHHTSEYGAAHVHSSFAAQLESYGMWEWAVFVLLHIPDNKRRQMAVLRMLERNLCSVGDKDYKKKEYFVKRKLKIPASWIYEIKAHKSLGQAKYHFAACFLNKAGQFNFAHKILMKHLAPEYVVNEKYKELLKLLKPLAIECKKENTLFNWEKGGYVIWLYLEVMTKINLMLKHPEYVDGYKLQKVQLDAISLCRLLPEFIVNTEMDRLCRIDICDRLFDLVGEFVRLQRNDQMSCRILLYMTTKLPMPDNFKIRERRNFIENWPADFANSRFFT